MSQARSADDQKPLIAPRPIADPAAGRAVRPASGRAART